MLKFQSAFKPDLVKPLGEGGFATVFKAKFHGKDVAMKYIPLDKVKKGYEYNTSSNGLHEYINQGKSLFKVILSGITEKLTSFLKVERE